MFKQLKWQFQNVMKLPVGTCKKEIEKIASLKYLATLQPLAKIMAARKDLLQFENSKDNTIANNKLENSALFINPQIESAESTESNKGFNLDCSVERGISFCEHGCISTIICLQCENENKDFSTNGYVYIKRNNAQLERRWLRLANKEL